MRLVKCKTNISDTGLKLDGLKVGNYYKLLDENSFGFLITDENGVKSWFMKYRFYPIDELREEKLKELGI